MPSRLQVLIVSHSEDAATRLRDCLSDASDLEVQTHIIRNGSSDPLKGVVTFPDLLLLQIGPDSREEFEALGRYTLDERPPLIVIGDGSDPQIMRAAMQAGARDFLSEPIVEEDLLATVMRLATESKPSRKNALTALTAFINVKGGSGATFLATNVAHLLTVISNRRTVLVDLDLRFGNLPQYLDLKPKRGLLEALDVASDLDEIAIEAYMTKHESGLSVLAALNVGVDFHQELMLDGFESVLALLSGNYERVIVDLPRQIDQLGALTLERADKIVLVMQQSVPGLHDAVRMYDILTKELAIPADRLTIIVNRYLKNASVQLTDIEQALHGKTPILVPNDFQAVAESVNIGVPIYDQARRSSVTKALLRLEELVDGRTVTTSKTFITRLRGMAG
ncbi:MAG: pilus assembly protein CpaF [Gammaproteobacteria bacterium]|nr:MAG: pilus assembly protein CpaF [Gammaproteobacteria bacterium]